MAKEQNPTNITIGVGRFSYLRCFKPEAMTEDGQKKYSVSFLIPKTDKKLIAKIEKAIEAAKEEGKEKKWKGKIPPKLKVSFYDGDTERPEDENYAGHMYLSCHSTTRPGVVNAQREPIIDEDEVGSGDYGYINVTVYPYNSNGSNGVAFSFNHLMMTKKGERLSGKLSVDAAFEGIEVEEDDDLAG